MIPLKYDISPLYFEIVVSTRHIRLKSRQIRMLVWLARKSNNTFELEEMLTNYKCTRDIQMEISRIVRYRDAIRINQFIEMKLRALP